MLHAIHFVAARSTTSSSASPFNPTLGLGRHSDAVALSFMRRASCHVRSTKHGASTKEVLKPFVEDMLHTIFKAIF